MVLEKGQVEAILCTSALPWGHWGCEICSYKLRSAVDMLCPFTCCGDVGQCTSLKSRANPKSSTIHLPPISSHDFPPGIMCQPRWCLLVVMSSSLTTLTVSAFFKKPSSRPPIPGFLPPLYVFAQSITYSFTLSLVSVSIFKSTSISNIQHLYPHPHLISTYTSTSSVHIYNQYLYLHLHLLACLQPIPIFTSISTSITTLIIHHLTSTPTSNIQHLSPLPTSTSISISVLYLYHHAGIITCF